ncbi:uncharacterized protein LOC135703677 [Ochlerotatus camptorhynchus]|uniref:uncharacterized protein LOC135703677 n=1 Tax=Ochlerotatus camptorhynchus TaxID=644619 RepID=UPI0031E34BA7
MAMEESAHSSLLDELEFPDFFMFSSIEVRVWQIRYRTFFETWRVICSRIPPDVVRLGDIHLELTTDDRYAQQLKVKRIISHPDRKPPRKYNDLALVELEKKVEITPGVCPACIWSKEVYPYDWFEVAGFGYTEYGVPSSSNLLKARLTLVNTTECASAYPADRGLPDGIRADQLCATSPHSDTCQGDSGGPLQTSLYSYQHIAHFLIGVTSFGRFCGHGSYGVYQKIEPHLNWIRSVVRDTLDPLECIQKYKDYVEPMQMPGETEVVDPYFSRVYLHWKDSKTDILCGGTLVDYNVVITSARCTFNSREESPTRISIIDRWAKIVEIERHPGFQQGSYYNDVALIRLDRYIVPAEWIVPVCLPYTSALRGYQIAPETFSCRTPKAPYPQKLQIYLPSKSRCDDQAIANDIEYSSKFPQGLGNAMSCIGTDYRMVPNLVEVDQGGPLLSRDETIIFGVNAYGTDCGSYNPLITTNVAPLIPWIEQFVFKQNVEISKPQEGTLIYVDKTLYIGSTCSTKDGKQGSCALTRNCIDELTRYKKREVEPAICGFVNERVVICCP